MIQDKKVQKGLKQIDETAQKEKNKLIKKDKQKVQKEIKRVKKVIKKK